MQPDPLSDVLSLLRPHTYVAGGFDLAGRWSVGFDPHTGIKCYSVVSGACWLVVEALGDPVSLSAGDCVLMPNGRGFSFTNDLSLTPIPFGELRDVEWRGGIAVHAGGGGTLILGGHFAFAGAHADVLLGAMPAVAYLADETDQSDLRWILERMRRELVASRPGGVLVAQHLAHMMLVQALRLYLTGGAGHQVGWLFALANPRLAAAIAAVHADPGAAWTLPMLAQRAGMSRSAFARVFKATVGSSPIDYLIRWRMLLAATQLTSGAASVAAIGRSVGYESEASFSTAFRRIMGRSPRQHARLNRSSPPSHPWAATALSRAGF